MDKPENQIKYENYREQFKRLNSALNNGFNLEAMFIEYAILEDRTESVLRHGGMWEVYLKSRRGHGPSIDSKVRYIQKLAEQKGSMPSRYFSDDLMDRILLWKEERNRLIHALLKQQLEHNEVSELAAQGKQLVDGLRRRAGNFNRSIERKRAKEIENE